MVPCPADHQTEFVTPPIKIFSFLLEAFPKLQFLGMALFLVK
jgi:hypothetical protein